MRRPAISPHDVGGQDLPALAGGTEPGRLDHRVPEVVVVLSGYFPTAEAHAQAHRVLTVPIVPFDALLHGHPTGQGGGGRPEDHHEAVAQVLDLGTAGLGDGLTQDREVSPADLVGDIGRQPLRQLRRAHHVGEQDRCALDGQETPSRLGTPA